MSIPIYLAAFSDEAERAAEFPPARLGCRLSPDAPALLAPDPPDDPASLMVLRDAAPPVYEPTPALAGMLSAYAQNYHSGLVCDWRDGTAPFYPALAAMLDESCAQLGLPLWLDSACAGSTQAAWVLTGSDITSGQYIRTLAEASARWPERSVLALRPLCRRCTLPIPGGELETEALAAVPEDESPVYFSEDLCCMYTTREDEGRAVFTLFDTRETLARKLQAAEDAGFRAVFGVLAELAAVPG